jgi:phosphatidylserine synthase 2
VTFFSPIACKFSLTELNSFYLKYVLWIPPENRLNAIRLIFMLLWGAVAIRETFQYLDDP